MSPSIEVPACNYFVGTHKWVPSDSYPSQSSNKSWSEYLVRDFTTGLFQNDEDDFDRHVDDVVGNGDSSLEAFNIEDLMLLDEPIEKVSSALVAEPMKSIDEQDEVEDEEPLEKPKRALSAYNLFFQAERQRILKTLPAKKTKNRKNHGKIGFADLARTISVRWKDISPKDKAEYTRLANLDGQRYQNEMKIWKRSQSSDCIQSSEKPEAKREINSMRGFASESAMKHRKSTSKPKRAQEEELEGETSKNKNFEWNLDKAEGRTVPKKNMFLVEL